MPTYTLITVTHSGAVHHSRGFENLRMCQEARCIALYGMTLAEKEEADRAHEEAVRRLERSRLANRDLQWRAKHPPRRPTPQEAADLRSLRLSWEVSDGPTERLREPDGGYVEVVLSRSVFCADCLIRDEFSIRSFMFVGHAVQWIGPPAQGTIRSAHCVIEVPDEPESAKAVA